jgi:hypothetical protein
MEKAGMGRGADSLAGSGECEEVAEEAVRVGIAEE